MNRAQVRDGSYPSIVINSIDMKKMLDLIGSNALADCTEFLLEEVQRLADARADLALLASNTPHVVFDDLRRRSPIPLVSIVEAACEATKALGLTKVGLFGTRFTMQGRFYAKEFSKHGIALAVPGADEQAYIHEKYMGELVHGVFLPETRERLLGIVDRLKTTERIQGLILGGTELPLAFRSLSGGTPRRGGAPPASPRWTQGDGLHGRMPDRRSSRRRARRASAEERTAAPCYALWL